MNKLELPLRDDNLLIRWANRMRTYYGHPIYLVGSQLSDKTNPTDVDVVCIIPDKEFSLRFQVSIGDWHQERGCYIISESYWEWTDRCVKDSLNGMRYTKLKIDFKVYPETLDLVYRSDIFPKLKLDTRK